MLEDALEVATDPDYKFDLAIQLGRLGIAKVYPIIFSVVLFSRGAFLEEQLGSSFPCQQLYCLCNKFYPL